MWMLWQCCNVGDWHWDNIQAALCECCGNVASNIGDRHWDNVQATLCECPWQRCSPGWWLMLRQHSGNIVWTLWKHHSPMLVTDVETMFRQCCVNVVEMSLPNVGDRENVQATLLEHCLNVAAQCWELMLVPSCTAVQYCTWSSQVQNDSYIKIWLLDTFATSTSMSTVKQTHQYLI